MSEPSPQPTKRTIYLVTAVAMVCFALGIFVGRSPADPSDTPNPAASSSPRATERPVEVRIDAGAIKLVPDASLHLDPIPPLNLDGGPQDP